MTPIPPLSLNEDQPFQFLDPTPELPGPLDLIRKPLPAADAHLVYFGRTLQEGDKPPPVMVIDKDILPVIPPVGDMIDGVLVLDP